MLFKKENYNPLMFLAALGAGGTSVTFFMYLMFVVPRDKTEYIIPTYDSLMTQFDKGDIFFNVIIILSILGIIFFAFKHIQLLIINLREYFAYRKTDSFTKMKTTNAEVTLMALPLTLAMTINVMFILGAVFIPGLWSVVEYLFPMALIGFGLVGILAIKTFGEYFTRLILEKGNQDFVNNNSLSQMISVFAFAMIAVGFAAPAAMSHNELTILLGLIGSIFFATVALFLTALKITLGFKAIFKHGIDDAASPTLWIMIPILTLLGITFIRQSHGLESFDSQITAAGFITLTTIVISLQILFGYLGYKVMKANKYFKKFIHGDKKVPGVYALICPGVALFVFGFFFTHMGLVKSGVLEMYSIAYWILLLPFIYIQFITIRTMFILNKKFFVK